MLTSPCIGNCQIEDETGFCLGCGRTRDEIGAWRGADDAFRQRVWAVLPERRAALGIGLHRLDWTTPVLRRFVVDSFRGGAWTVGAPGAVAEFCLREGEASAIDADGDAIRCRSTLGAVAFEIDDSVRAFAVGRSGSGDIIVLAKPRSAVITNPASVLSARGPDFQAVREEDRGALLYDFGLGRVGASFCVRTREPALTARLDALAGRDRAGVIESLGDDIHRISPHRVVLTPVGRIEVYSRIPPPDGVSPDGPHTHFLPRFFAEDRETPAGIEMPRAYVACALYYPRAPR